MQSVAGGDLVRLDTAVPYSGSYNDVVDQGQREVNAGFEPELKPLPVNVADYDVIAVGDKTLANAQAIEKPITETGIANIRDTRHAYQIAKRGNEKRDTAQAVEWGKRGARLNDIAPGIIVTPLALDEFNGPRGDFYKNMFAKCPTGRPGTADEVANVAKLLMSDKGAFITGSTFLIDGGATASYFYGPLRPEKA